MSREIGGYLELERYQGEPYHPGAVALNSARNCLAYLAELRGIERIALPDLMCDAVSGTCEREGIAVRTFEVGEGFALPSELAVSEGEWLYVADYYGRLSCSEVERARSASGGRLVVDEVQGFFREPWAGVDTIYTCRKFFGVPDGAYLITRDGSRLGRELPKGSSRARMAHVVGRMEDGSAEWYGAYRASEESIAAAVSDMKGRGIRNVLALRGDLPEGYKPGDFKLAKDLIPRLTEAGFCVGAAAYPEGHIDCDSMRLNVEHLKQKEDAGAEFFVSQLFFDNEYFYRFREQAEAAGIRKPITAGIMPFMSKAQISRMVFMCGASLPSPIIKLLARYENDPASLRQAGIEYACRQLTDLQEHGVDGLHVYTMNNPEIARAAMCALKVALVR